MTRASAVLAAGLVTACSASGAGDGDGSSPAGAKACDFANAPLAPFAAEEPAMWVTDVDGLMKRGLVAVRFDGCTLTVLSRCRVPGEYEFVHRQPTRQHIEARSADELRRKLPLGGDALSKRLPAGGAIRLEVTSIGDHQARTSPYEMRGECRGATHFMRSVEAGAYTLDVVTKDGEAQRLHSAGDHAACVGRLEGAPPDGCGGLLQLSLEPLPEPGSLIAPPGDPDARDAFCARYREDRTKLERIKQLEDEIMSAGERAGYERDFDAAYGPKKADLERSKFCGLPPPTAGEKH